MDFVTWTKAFKVGVPFVDADHRILVDLINQVNACIDKREETTTLASVLGTLFDYTEYHFSREEKLMELSNYGGLGLHKIIHRSLAKQVYDIDVSFREDPGSVNATEVRDFLNNWLLEHISGHDFEYREACLKNKTARDKAGAIRFMEDEITGSRAHKLADLSVMVVDDNKNFLQLVETILKAIGVRRVQLEQFPEKAIDKLIKRPTDLVFCDWVMEDMNGAEFAQKVKDMGLPTKVVLLTGYSVETLQMRSSSDAVEGYLEKPITAKSLIDSISAITIN
ncbi:MAG: bacteriohemerythrin [Rhodospirillaceae bacterium]|jgi:hemerythrin-like metal-binding protein|nr:bacteriohemerythrin [Rhodospirillaceae bacterium]MBT5243284.1 bacteriohemerythrin [Rhodospirillaceae bacterium]MBT5563932.1 bacteriohemerythrin [Rhodospirillaceae bacterium]MBT6240864.1 bacteriohemerythrin [Rhodospirillaceae bacterium]MBT7137331.1 bacteriohemerythrin [Rhodospirillaceae bacterium]